LRCGLTKVESCMKKLIDNRVSSFYGSLLRLGI
jgi:hypothetical protein